MKEVRLYKKGAMHSLRVRIADSFLHRFLGLMGRRLLPENEGLLITPCNSVHMCFMRFSIDVVYLVPELEGYRIVKIVTNLQPWLGLSACWKAKCTLEMAAGSVAKYNLKKDDILIFNNFFYTRL